MIFLNAAQMRLWEVIPAEGTRLAYSDCKQRARLGHDQIDAITGELEAMGILRYNSGYRTLQRVNPQPIVRVTPG